jgi:hypothetical protein
MHRVTSPSTAPTRVLGDVLVVGLGLALGLLMLVVAPSAHAKASTPTCVPRSTSTSWQSAVASASTALSTALADIKNGHYVKATDQLRTMRHKTQAAHTAAAALIGAPPTDPESDDPPGVAAVLRVGSFEHRVTMALVPLFSDPHGLHVLRPLTGGINQAVACRKVMLNKVIALKAAKRDDYVDGLSDTLPGYAKELSTISTELAGSGLTTGGRTALNHVHEVVAATQAAMQKVFGGGERSPRSAPEGLE